jgi:hypothetical protein
MHGRTVRKDSATNGSGGANDWLVEAYQCRLRLCGSIQTALSFAMKSELYFFFSLSVSKDFHKQHSNIA